MQCNSIQVLWLTTSFVCPIRYTRLIAWSSRAGFMQGSSTNTWDAAVKVKPTAPTRTDSKNTVVGGSIWVEMRACWCWIEQQSQQNQQEQVFCTSSDHFEKLQWPSFAESWSYFPWWFEIYSPKSNSFHCHSTQINPNQPIPFQAISMVTWNFLVSSWSLTNQSIFETEKTLRLLRKGLFLAFSAIHATIGVEWN